LKHTWKIIGDRFEALNERERWMVFCALFVVVFASINILLLNPVLEQKKVLSNGIAMDQAQTLEIKQQMDALARQQVVDPDIYSNWKLNLAACKPHSLALTKYQLYYVVY
jgi:MSHA biogenesis protein MshJ